MDPKGFVSSSHQHKGSGHNFQGDPCPEGQEPFVPGYVHHYKGPHGTDIANKLDPHVPGDFPSDNGLDTHERGLAGQHLNTTGSQHHGIDAALGAGAGAAGLGAYETLKHGDHTSSDSNVLGQRGDFSNTSSTGVPSSSNDVPSSSTGVPSSTGASSSSAGRSFPLNTYPTDSTSTGDHHLGRDAALIGGGLGAAGLGAHEAFSHRPGHEIEGYEDQRFDPSASSADKPARIPNLHYNNHSNAGQDAALVGGAGVAGTQLSGYNHGGSTATDPASKTIGPHKSNILNILDPRVQPEPEKMKDRTTAGPHQSDMLNRADPRVDSDLSKQDNHHGRDAALAGGAGAAGIGGYEALHNREHNPTSSTTGAYPTNSTTGSYPTGSTTGAYPTNTSDAVKPALAQQTKEHHHGRDAAVAGGAGAAGIGGYEALKHHGGSNENPLATSTFDPRSTNTNAFIDPRTDPALAQQSQGHHYGRDAAVAGGVGAAGVGGYEALKHHDGSTNNPLTTSNFDPRSTNTNNLVDPNTDPTLAQQTQGHHYGRDAAVVGGAGAAAYGAHEALDPKEQEKLAKHQAKEAEKAEKAHQHQVEKDLKHQQKEREHEIAKQEKAAHKEHEHEQKKAAAAAAAATAAEEKKHKHALEKAEKEREKEADRSEKEAEKATRENEHPEKKSHSLLGFLHRDKKSEPEEPLRQQGNLREADIAAHERHQGELEAAAARGQVDAAGAEFEPPLAEQRQHSLADGSGVGTGGQGYSSIDEHGHQTVSTDTTGRHRLHKDPPASVLKERGLLESDNVHEAYGSGIRRGDIG
jgi:hypothetical protein